MKPTPKNPSAAQAALITLESEDVWHGNPRDMREEDIRFFNLDQPEQESAENPAAGKTRSPRPT